MRKLSVVLCVFLFQMFFFVQVFAQEALSYYGSGEDVVFADVSLVDYPFILVKNTGIDYFTVSILDRNDKKNVVANGVGDHFGVYLKRIKNFGKVNRIKFTGNGEWKVSFLPDNDVYIKEFTGPITVTGEGAAVFYVRNPGDKAQINIEYPEQTTISQFTKNFKTKSVLVSKSAGTVSAKLDPDYTLFTVESTTKWSISFPGKKNEPSKEVINISGLIYEPLEIDTSGVGANPYTEIDDLQGKIKQMEEMIGTLTVEK